jgi:hypothetical protein
VACPPPIQASIEKGDHDFRLACPELPGKSSDLLPLVLWDSHVHQARLASLAPFEIGDA